MPAGLLLHFSDHDRNENKIYTPMCACACKSNLGHLTEEPDRTINNFPGIVHLLPFIESNTPYLRYLATKVMIYSSMAIPDDVYQKKSS